MSASSSNSEGATTQEITVQDTGSKECRVLTARNQELVAENRRCALNGQIGIDTPKILEYLPACLAMTICAVARLQQQCDTLSEENLRLKEAVACMREEMVQISKVHRALSHRHFVDCRFTVRPQMYHM